MKKKITLLLIPIIGFSLIIGIFNFLLLPVDKNKGISLVKINQGDNISEIAQELKNKNLIRNVLAFKTYVKIKKLSGFQAGYYEVSRSMNSKIIANKMNSGDVVFPDEIKVTFKEGSTLPMMAKVLSEKINSPADEIVNVWNSPEFLKKAADRYDFISDNILNPLISYPLTGYFFPETYFLTDAHISSEEVAFRFLDEMQNILDKYKHEINNSEFSIHEILTLSSIVEYEAKEDEDRPIIAGVFINRIHSNMKLESCATLEMATGIHKEQYKSEDIHVDSPYNTYFITGLPIGPGNCPGEQSIKAVLYPAKHDYYFFLSDVYGDNKVYYAKTLREHNKLKNKYLR